MFAKLFESWLGRSTLIAADDTWALLALLCLSVGLAVWLEQRYLWASKISGALIALLVALAASNLSVIPTKCVLYDDIIWGYAVPLGIPLLLLQCNMRRIWKETGACCSFFSSARPVRLWERSRRMVCCVPASRNWRRWQP